MKSAFSVLNAPAPGADELLAALKLPGGADDPMAEEARGLTAEAAELAAPKAVYAEFTHDDLAAAGITAPFVLKMLAGSRVLVACIATCGTELETWSAEKSDPLEAYWADALKLACLAPAQRALTAALKREFFAGSDGFAAMLNPGSLEAWPISEQPKLFSLLRGGAEAIGVSLRPSFLMIPTKSVSGICFESRTEYENCSLCPRTTCPNRRAPFTGAV